MINDIKSKLSLVKLCAKTTLRRPRRMSIRLFGLAFAELFFKYHHLDNSMTRAEILRSAVFPLYELDDIVDETDDITKSQNLVKEKTELVTNLADGKDVTAQDDIDRALQYNAVLSERIGISLSEEIAGILHTLELDAQRKEYFQKNGKYRILPDAELKKIYLDCCLDTLRAIFKIFGTAEFNERVMTDYAIAGQTVHNIKDSIKDAKLGFCNISKEDMEKHGICPDDVAFLAMISNETFKKFRSGNDSGEILTTIFPSSIRDLFLEQKDRSLEQIANFKLHKKTLNMNRPTAMVTDHELNKAEKFLLQL